ncbi:hypothetical protein [Ectobacillus funiculus]|uniref:Uncharacterized protein n=1 Tax=Ectobacillus funiculus TaxID=137993 RepID=A0ABV5WF73_9BACI
MRNLQIEKITVPFQGELLTRWKERDPLVVPEYALKWNGKGVSNGFGFGEWLAEEFFRNQGYYIINDEFDLFSKNSKYKVYNDIISLIVGKEKIEIFRRVARVLYEDGYKIENLDLFIFDRNSFLFAEAKKGKDCLREPQLRFMYLAKEILDADCKLVYLSEVENETRIETLNFQVNLPENFYDFLP